MSLTVSVVLGFSKSAFTVIRVSTSYPLTYAFPGEICKVNNSSEGIFPCFVNCPGL